MKRSLLGVLVGVVVSAVVIAIVQAIGHQVYPLPKGINPGNMEALKQLMPTMPLGAFFFVLGSYILGTWAGVWTTCRLTRPHPFIHGWITGGILLILGIVNQVILPHPLWFSVASLAIFVGITGLVVSLSRSRE